MKFRFLSSGESHGKKLTAIIDGVPANFNIDIEKGKLMVGYWWSDQQTVRLERIICEKYS